MVFLLSCLSLPTKLAEASMPDLRFGVEAAEPAHSAAVPTVIFRLRIENTPAEQRIHSALLRCQIQIEPGRRSYSGQEQERLYEVFDRPERWGKTLQPMLWINAVTVVPAFTGS